ncbi:MAG: hypothetical protein V4501_03645 [Pseudomonadota bacterium]
MTLSKRLARMTLLLVLGLLPTFAHSEASKATINLTCLPSGICNGSLLSQGKTRTFHYYMHGGVGGNLSNIYRIIFVLHDSTSDGGSTFDTNVLGGSFDNLADTRDFIVVYPDAYNNKRWNFGPDSTVTDVDDVGFIKDLMDYFENTHGPSKLRKFAVGMANGGLMVFRLGCELSNRLNGIAVVAATMPVSLAKTCKPTHPISVLLFEGHEDTLVPRDKNYMYDFADMPPIATLTPAQTFDFWAAMDHITSPPKFITVPVAKYDGTEIFKEDRGTKTLMVRLYTIFGAGHTWPGGIQYLPEKYVGKVTHNLEASPVIVNFFYAQ